jgi:hypothetical protein
MGNCWMPRQPEVADQAKPAIGCRDLVPFKTRFHSRHNGALSPEGMVGAGSHG